MSPLHADEPPPSTVLDSADLIACPASGVQRGLWFLDRLTPGQPTYNVVTALDCLGDLRLDIFQRCIDTLVERHESLRTTFSSQDGEPLQIIHPTLAVPVVVVAAAGQGSADAEALSRAAHEAATPFDLTAGPLLRVRVLVIEPRRQLVVITAHHIVFDGWSVAIFCQELSVLYRAYSAGKPSPLPPVDIQYADYVVWQQKRLTPERVATQLDYWRATLGSAGEPVEIGSRPRPARPTGHGATLTWSLDARVTEGLRRLCRAEQATTFMAVVTLLDVLLARHTGAEEMLFGTPLASRSRPELEHTVGFFANTVVVRSDLSGAPTFRQLLRRVKAAALGAMAHADVPYQQVVQAVQPARGLGQTPIFRVMVAVQRVPDVLVELDGLDVRVLRLGSGTAKFDLLLDVQERADDIELAFEYSTDVIDDETCRRWRARFTQLVEAACAAPDMLIAELPVVTADEARDLARWNVTTVARDETATPVSLVARQAARTPDAPAVSFAGTSLSYRGLEARANQVAHALRARGVQRGDRVGLGLDRSLDLAVAVLGVLKAGAAYVPIDPAYPVDRVRFMVEDADVRVLLATPALAASVLGDDPARRGFADWVRAASLCPTTAPDVAPSAGDACYVMYTSGSTGQPKGVVMPHGPLANLVEWQARRSAPALTTLQFSAISFDVSFQEHFATWATGGHLVLIGEAARRDPRTLLETLRTESVERLFLPFVALQLLADTARDLDVVPPSLKEIITAGEQLRLTPALRWLFGRLRGATLDNQYGPTETHVVTAQRLSGDPEAWPELPPIGRPIDNVQVLLLDQAQRPVPPGVTGELWLAGAALADGYHRRPDLTADRFRTIAVPGYLGRAYRSGDAGRHGGDGAIEFLGRRDDQVKIRGFRVEPGEIEAALEAHPAVRQAAVVARPDGRGVRLVAYYVPVGRAATAEALREHLARRLPDYMVPAGWVSVPSFPQTPSGKIDRRRLPEEPEASAPAVQTIAPHDAVEAQLLAIWREVLAAPDLSPRDDFFGAGGHSLAAARLFTLIEKRIGQTLPLSAIYDYPTVATLAAVLRENRPASDWPALHVLVEGPGRPLFCVHSISGDIMEYRALADAIGPDQPFIGIRAKLGADVATMYATIEATAAAYVADLIAYQPRGPYMLAGWSAGGTVAFEMAQQLRAKGHSVSLLAVLDNAPYNTGYEPRRTPLDLVRQVANVPAWIRDDVAKSTPAELRARVRQKLVTMGRKSLALLRRAEDQVTIRDVVAFPQSGERWETFVAAHYRALLAYVPRPYPGRVTVFKATTHPLLRLHDADRMWRMLSPDVDVHMVPGTHFSIVKDPHVRALGAGVRAAIARAGAAISSAA